jgi:RNA polymerase sigma-70 factor (ECF subfamily)
MSFSSDQSWTDADGDADADFVALRADLLRLASGVTRSRDAAEDVVQEVWLRWRRHRGSITSPSPWLRAVTRNLALDRLRDRKVRREAACDPTSLPEPSVDAEAPAVETEVDVSRALQLVLASLTTLERAVFVLHSGLDWSYADIARLFDRSESAVRQLQHRARQHLATGVRRFDVEPETVAAVTSAYVGVSAGRDVFALLDVLAPGLASPTPVFSRGGYRVVHDVAGIVLFHRDRLLLCHRRDRLPWYPSVWDVPGAHLRHGEPAIACAVRAARQKLEVSVSNPRQVGEVYDDDYRLSLFEGVDWAGEPRNLASDHHDQIGLFTLDQAAQLQLADRRLLTLFDRPAA